MVDDDEESMITASDDQAEDEYSNITNKQDGAQLIYFVIFREIEAQRRSKVNLLLVKHHLIL